MFLLPSLLFGLLFAVLLGGKPARLIAVNFRLGWTVLLALGLQIVLFSRAGAGLEDGLRSSLHLASYGFLIAFALVNLRLRALAPVLFGMGLNAVTIAANGGRMPVSESAARAAGIPIEPHSNVSASADRLWFLGDVFAVPSGFPLANVFSVGDLLIAFGVASFIVFASLEDGGGRALSPSRMLEPLRTPTYRRLAGGKLISQIGDWVTLAALIGWIYDATGSTGHVAGLLLVRLAPPIVGGSIAALLVDRLPKQRLLVWIEIGRGLVVGAALVGVLAGENVLVYAALAASGALAAMSAAAVPALVPSLLPAAQLPAANAALGMTKDAAMAIGAVGAGVALSSVGAAPALIVDLATFAAAALLYNGLRLEQGVARARTREDGALAGLRYMLTRRRLLLLVFSFATATLATGLTNASLPRFLEGEVGLGSGGYGFGIAALATGLLLGEALVGFSRVGPTAGRWIGGGLVIMSGLFVLLSLVEHAPTALLLLGAIGFVDGTTDVLFDTVVQREVDPRYYGCVFGFASAFMTATMTGAFAIAPLANRILEPQHVMVGVGAVLVLAGTLALLGMGRRSSVTPVPATAESG